MYPLCITITASLLVQRVQKSHFFRQYEISFQSKADHAHVCIYLLWYDLDFDPISLNSALTLGF